jgi:glyoxylase I family protein
MIIAIHHVSLLVSDTQRALDFYHGILGLEVDKRRPEMGFPGAWLLAGAQQIHLIERTGSMACSRVAEASAPHGGRDFHIALAVTDLAALSARLTGHGVPCTPSRSGRRALFCRDPDGNAIELMERITGYR